MKKKKVQNHWMIFLLVDSNTLIERNQKYEATLRDRGYFLHVVEFDIVRQ